MLCFHINLPKISHSDLDKFQFKKSPIFPYYNISQSFQVLKKTPYSPILSDKEIQARRKGVYICCPFSDRAEAKTAAVVRSSHCRSDTWQGSIYKLSEVNLFSEGNKKRTQALTICLNFR